MGRRCHREDPCSTGNTSKPLTTLRWTRSGGIARPALGVAQHEGAIQKPALPINKSSSRNTVWRTAAEELPNSEPVEKDEPPSNAQGAGCQGVQVRIENVMREGPEIRTEWKGAEERETIPVLRSKG